MRRVEYGTPEDVALGFPLAGIGNRVIAAAIDMAITGAISVLVLALLIVLALSTFASARALFGDLVDSRGPPGTAILWFVAAFYVIQFVVQWGYFVAAELLWNGASPGKRAVGIRVIRDGGYPITFTSSVLRNLGRLADLLPGSGLAGLLSIFLTRDEKRLGDLLAGTVVVREPREEPAFEPFEGQRWSTMDGRRFSFDRAGLLALGPEHLQLLRAWFRRMPELPPEALSSLRARLADALAARVLPEGERPTTDEEREALLRELLLALRERLEFER